MSNEEHYFENLLFNGNDDLNKKELSNDIQRVIKICADYVLYSLFNGRKDFLEKVKENISAEESEGK